MKLLLAVGIALSLSSSAAPASSSFKVFDRPPKWLTGCDAKRKDAFGDSKRVYCWLTVSNSPSALELMDDNSFVMSYETILEVDAKGIKIRKPLPRRLCEAKGSPRRIAVDGKRIDALPTLQQIQAMLAGKKLVWETQAEWPYCGIAGHGTYLDGMREAMEELQSKWNAIK